MKNKKSFCSENLRQSGSLILIAALFAIGVTIAMATGIPVASVMENYSYNVLVILIVMELFTSLIVECGIMQFIAVKIATFSQGKKRLCLVLFGGMMFLISACLNNITSVLIILPVILVLFKTLEIDKRYVSVFFATILALCNLGGMGSPIGDFPALLIMTSGITSFLSYLTHAFPLALITALVLLAVWSMTVKKESGPDAMRTYAVLNLKSQYKFTKVRFDVLKWLGGIFVGMFLAWSIVPQNIIPPEIIAILGYVAAMVVSGVKGIKVKQTMDMKSVLTIGSFLFFAEVVSQTGVLVALANFLQTNIDSPKLLIMVIMVITSLVAGLFSAGPAAAAMMPVIVQLCNGPLSAQSDWIAVAYAAAICAGSSLFMWSATAGFILSGKVTNAELEDTSAARIPWGIPQYMKYGFVNYAIQLGIALIVITCVL